MLRRKGRRKGGTNDLKERIEGGGGIIKTCTLDGLPCRVLTPVTHCYIRTESSTLEREQVIPAFAFALRVYGCSSCPLSLNVAVVCSRLLLLVAMVSRSDRGGVRLGLLTCIVSV